MLQNDFRNEFNCVSRGSTVLGFFHRENERNEVRLKIQLIRIRVLGGERDCHFSAYSRFGARRLPSDHPLAHQLYILIFYILLL